MYYSVFPIGRRPCPVLSAIQSQLFHLATFFEFVTARSLPQPWKRSRSFTYDIIRHLHTFSDLLSYIYITYWKTFVLSAFEMLKNRMRTVTVWCGLCGCKTCSLTWKFI